MTLLHLAAETVTPDNASKIGLGGASVLIFVISAAFSLLRGLVRMVIGTVVLVIAGYVGYLVWGHFPSFSGLPWLSFAVPAAAGLVVFVALRMVVGFFSKPFSGENGERSMLQKLMRMGVSLVPASALWFSGATAVHHFGSVSEIADYAGSTGQGAPTSQAATFLTNAKAVIDKYLPAGWFQKVDPLSDDARVNLAKLIAAGDSKTPPKAIPVLEEPEIRDLILKDPHLRELAREKRYGDILRDPKLDNVVNNPDLRRLLASTPL